jgi:hypothetical protein
MPGSGSAGGTKLIEPRVEHQAGTRRESFAVAASVGTQPARVQPMGGELMGMTDQPTLDLGVIGFEVELEAEYRRPPGEGLMGLG